MIRLVRIYTILYAAVYRHRERVKFAEGIARGFEARGYTNAARAARERRDRFQHTIDLLQSRLERPRR